MENNMLSKGSLIVRRIGAYITDYILITFISMIPIFLNFSKLTGDPGGFFELFFLIMLIALVCYIIKDIFGRSPGKLLFGIYVREAGNPDKKPNIFKLLLRNLLILIWPVEFIMLLVDRDNRRLGDKIAGTRVLGYKNNITVKLVLVSVAAFFLIIVTFIGTLLFSIVQFMKNDGSYKTSINYIENQTTISEEIGGIKGYGFFPTGNIGYTNGIGTADLSIKVLGNKKDVVVHIALEKDPGKDWTIVDAETSEGDTLPVSPGLEE